MIVTAGSAILNAYLLSLKGKVQAAPGSIRSAAQRRRPQERGGTLPGTPGLRDNLVGRLRGALGWFSRLPVYQRRSILRRGLIGTVAALAVGLVAITAIEFGIGNSLSCGLWGRCPVGASPGIGGGAYGAGAEFSALGGRAEGVAQQNATGYEQPQQDGGLFGGGQDEQPVQPQGGGLFGGGQSEQPVQPQQQGGGLFGGGQQPAQPQQPVPAEPVPPEPVPAEPIPPEPVPEEPVQPEPPAPAE